MRRDMIDDHDDGSTYVELEIEGSSPDIDIWLGDDAGHLVQKEAGVLRTRVIPGHYVVELALGTSCDPIDLRDNSRLTQREIDAGPSCPRPVVCLEDLDGA